MSDRQLFRGFSEEEQEKMAAEAEQRWDPETVRASNARWKQYPPEKKQRILDEGNAVYTDMIAAMSEGPSSPKVQAIVKRWHDHMQYFWSPNDEQLLGSGRWVQRRPAFPCELRSHAARTRQLHAGGGQVVRREPQVGSEPGGGRIRLPSLALAVGLGSRDSM